MLPPSDPLPEQVRRHTPPCLTGLEGAVHLVDPLLAVGPSHAAREVPDVLTHLVIRHLDGVTVTFVVRGVRVWGTLGLKHKLLFSFPESYICVFKILNAKI